MEREFDVCMSESKIERERKKRERAEREERNRRKYIETDGEREGET